jgi:hypothetical protein
VGQVVTSGPSLGPTVWDGITVINHCTLTRRDEPLGVLFLMEFPSSKDCPVSKSYRIELIEPMKNGASQLAGSVRRELVSYLEEELLNSEDRPQPVRVERLRR